MIEPARIRIWDRPVRIFHWLIVLLIPVMWYTAEEDLMEQHRIAGFAMLGLLLFRILWGFVGSSTARFSNFVRGPRGVLLYLRGRAPHTLGHSPLGGYSVLAMLGLLSVQVTLGLFASDEDGFVSGPLARFISYDLSREIAILHEDMFDVLLVLIGLHVAAILYYALVRRRNLITPMLTGSGTAPAGVEPMVPAAWWLFALAASLAAAMTGAIVAQG
jgi:cytochrome b